MSLSGEGLSFNSASERGGPGTMTAVVVAFTIDPSDGAEPVGPGSEA